MTTTTETRTDRAIRLIRRAERQIAAALAGTAPRGDLDARLAIRDASEAVNAICDASAFQLAQRLNAATRSLNLARR